MNTVHPEIWQIDNLELFIRCGIAVVLGGLIGIEREWGDHPAGFRTHILVCLGSALIIMLSMYGFSQFVTEPNVRLDPARLAAQVISGIGFLGAGTILRTGKTVSGLTTAASLWVVAAIGLAVGAGFYFGAFTTTVLVLVSLFVLNKLEKKLTRHRKNREIKILLLDEPGNLKMMIGLISNLGIHISHLQVDTTDEGEGHEDSAGPLMLKVRLEVKMVKPHMLQMMLDALTTMKDVRSIETDIPIFLNDKKPKAEKVPFI
jgi:putative Mg2+ transporter-C (MgtC) family protein